MFATAFARSLRRELTHLVQNRWDRALLLWLPLLTAVILIAVFSAGQIRELPIAVLDHDGSAASRQLVRLVDAAPGVRVAASFAERGEAISAVRARKLYGILEISGDFGRKLKTGQQADVLFFYNAQFATAAGILARDVQAACLTFGAGVRVLAREKRGENPVAVAESAQPVRTRLISAFNESIDYRVFLAGSLFPAVLQIFVMVIGASVVGREIRDRTLGEWLAHCEGCASGALAGKLTPAALIYSFWALAFLALWGHAAGGLPAAKLALLAVGILAMVAAYLLLGAFTVASSANLRSALSSAGFYTAPAFAYVGQTFPLMAMPVAAKIWAAILPLTWWLRLQTEQGLMDAPFTASLKSFSVLLGFAFFSAPLAILALHRIAAQPQRWGAR
jgi:ABC-2 type transport system permease protein